LSQKANRPASQRKPLSPSTRVQMTNINVAELCEIYRACVKTTLFPRTVAGQFERYETALRRQTSPEEVNYLRLQFKGPVDRIVLSVLSAETEDEVDEVLRQMSPPVAVLYKERVHDVQEFLDELSRRVEAVRLSGNWGETLRALLIDSHDEYLSRLGG